MPAIEERLSEGLAEREKVPLEAHAEWEPPADRPDPIALIERQNESRVAELVPIRHGRMSRSPFTFFRGTAAIMASDLSRTPTSGLRVQCCGDAHLSNFGVFAAPDRRLVFDLNDFDETLPAPFEWDVKRLVASVVVAARDNGHRRKEQRAAARATVAAYRGVIAKAAAMRFLDVWYARIDADDLATEMHAGKAAKKVLAKARTRTSLGSLTKLAERVDGGYRIRERPPLIVRPPAAMRIERLVEQGLRDYAESLTPDRHLVLDQYHYEDVARKVVGVGSVGTQALVLLLMGPRDDDPLFLQIKQASASVLEPYAGAGAYEHQGERVVQGQRLMQAASDAFLGWFTGSGDQRLEFYVRQLRDMKGSAEVEDLTPSSLARYGALCGANLARAHARTGNAAKLAGYLGADDEFDRALQRFAFAYADQNDADYAAFVAAAEEGRIPIQRDV
jgi:uncharacterized protein (DUF2252 family)